jgi:hypothetical protein
MKFLRFWQTVGVILLLFGFSVSACQGPNCTASMPKAEMACASPPCSAPAPEVEKLVHPNRNGPAAGWIGMAKGIAVPPRSGRSWAVEISRRKTTFRSGLPNFHEKRLHLGA